MLRVWSASSPSDDKEIHDPPVPIHHEPEPDDPEPDDETRELIRPVKV